MRPFLCLALLALLAAPAASAEMHQDATIRAVQFIDEREGWAVGDEGVIWHSIDAGKNWERLPSGQRSSLQSLHFLNPYVGWVVGREELPGGGSVGVVLYTRDGGLSWRRLLNNSLPGLHLVRFVDEKTGYLAGEGSDQFPSGVFATTDGGRNWQPVEGPRAAAWRGGDFDAEGGALGGAWNRLATVRRGKVHQIDMDSLGGRAICSVQLRGADAVAVGQGGLVLRSSKTRGSTWDFVDLKLSQQARGSWDFHAVGGVGQHVWAVGRPGSVMLHSPDLGNTWEVVRTSQNTTLHGVYFRDEKHGWAVGELGTIIATDDGGKTWQMRQRGGRHVAALCVHARPAGVPLDVVALLGGQDGYLTAGLCVTAPEPASAALSRVGEPARVNEAFRLAGGVAGSMLWQFPVASHLARADRAELMHAWDKAHGDQAARELLAQLVLALRIYRPEVVVTDHPDAKRSGHGSDALVAEAINEAFARAADKDAFPEQLTTFGLEPFQAKKLYAVWPDGADAQVRQDLTALSPRLGATVREFSTAPLALLGDGVPPKNRAYKLLADNLKDSFTHSSLMQGITLQAGGFARRKLEAAEEFSAQEAKAARLRETLWTIAEAPADTLTNPDRLLAQLGPALAEMPLDAGARVAHGLAWQYARRGQWMLARETFLLLAERFPTHPLAIDAYRWLMQHSASSEARRRHELGQFLVVNYVNGSTVEQKTIEVPQKSDDEVGKTQKVEVPQVTPVKFDARHGLTTKEDARRWYEGALSLNEKLSAFGPLHGSGPAVRFCVQSARRQLGDSKGAMEWYRTFAAEQPAGPWKQAAAAELWLANRVGEPPRPALTCRPTESRPYLDGILDDDCWQAAKPVTLKEASGKMGKDYATEVRLAHDREFVYVAVRCAHPEGESTPAAQRTRDGDLRKNDRISILLDLDRDYSTCFHLQVDASGCVAEDCWGDRSWSPRWFVAIHREKRAWTLEAAIPRDALTGDFITPGQAWAANVVRVLPGKGVQAMSLPAEAPEEALRPEGMGLLLFVAEEQQRAERKK